MCGVYLGIGLELFWGFGLLGGLGFAISGSVFRD